MAVGNSKIKDNYFAAKAHIEVMPDKGALVVRESTRKVYEEVDRVVGGTTCNDAPHYIGLGRKKRAYE